MPGMNTAWGTKSLWMCVCEDTFMSLNLIMKKNEKCHNSDMQLSFLGIDCTDFIQTGHNRKLVFTLYKKNAVKFLITALVSEIFQSKVYLTSIWRKIPDKLLGSAASRTDSQCSDPIFYQFSMYLASRRYRVAWSVT